jgi:glucose-6-phosphate isomerase/transaldolase/glucose-6-phosphate isomerase
MDALQRLAELDAVRRLRTHDAALFADTPEGIELAESSLGWTDLSERGSTVLPELDRLALEAVEEGVTDVVLLGMGGSSLASLVLSSVLGESGNATLHVLDTTDPRTVDRAIADLDPATTLYIVASKSGGTIEPLSLYAIFRDVVDGALGREEAGHRFIAITDPGSGLEKLALAEGFRTLVSSPATVGGRFSAMSVFGLVPAALIGVDVEELLARGEQMEGACSLQTADNPAARLAAFIDDARRSGRDKLTIVASPPLATFGLWVEQLVAESLGKEGTGIVPVVELSDDFPRGYGDDRAVVAVRLHGDERLAGWVPALGESTPVMELVLRDGYDVAAEFTRWEHAVALLGPLLGVNPFGQPNVQAAKDATAAALAGMADVPMATSCTADGSSLTFAGGLSDPGHADQALSAALGHTIAALGTHDFLAVLAYLPDDAEVLAPLVSAVPPVSAALGRAITLELGPRYLHSTGQLHKGGPNNGVFVLLTTRDAADAPVPGRPWCLRTLHRAQAEGDLVTLVAADRRVLRIDLQDASVESVTLVAHALMDAAGVVWES